MAVMAIIALLATNLQWNAERTLNDLGGIDTAVVDPTDTPQPSDTSADTSPDATSDATPTPTPSLVTLPPGETPSPPPEMTPALTPAPAGTPPGSYAVTNALRPTLGNAARDYERPWKDNCLGWNGTTMPPAWGKCVYGNTHGTYQVALIGDSHGSALFPAVNAVALAHGWKLVVYVKIDCSFVDIPIMNLGLKRAYPECATWNNNVIARLNAHPPDLAIVAMSRWVFNVNAGDGSVAAQGNAMAREMEKIPSTSKLVMIQDIPDPWNMSVPDCLSTYISDYRRCAYARSVGFGSYQGKREAIAAKAAGAGLVSFASSICPGTGACPAVINGMIVFRDQHHLTATFAQSLGPVLDQQLVAILTGSPSAPSSKSTPVPTPSPTASAQ